MQIEKYPIEKYMEIKVKYFNTDLEKIKKIDQGDWIDLRCAETTTMSLGQFKLIPLGVAIQLPSGYEAHIVPRSSTYKNFGIIQANSMGIIDESYCGNNDQWYFPAIALAGKAKILFNQRICQFRIIKKQPKLEFQEVERLKELSRGGFGSTGIE